MASSDPFTGIRLSEQTAGGKLEQRLFTAETPEPRPEPKPSPATTDARPQKSSPPAPLQAKASGPAVEPPAPSISRRFALNDQPLYKASFLFTQEELEALEDLKLELRRDLDKKVTKNDLARIALHMLLEDYSANRERSFARRKVEKR